MRDIQNRDMVAEGSTALFSAMKFAFDLSFADRNRKTIFFVITDGHDNDSDVSDYDIRQYVERFRQDGLQHPDREWTVVLVLCWDQITR